MQVLDKPCKRNGTSKKEMGIVKAEQAKGLNLERKMMMIMMLMKTK